MSIFTKTLKLSSFILNPSNITCNVKYLFVLTHMRSRSSVLSHILGTNDGVCGYRELHNSYKNQIDLFKMRIILYEELKCNLKEKYLMDKLLHNNLVISKEILKTINTKIIFLLRDAKSTIKSAINMGYITGSDRHKNPEKVLEYYCSRLYRLEEYAKISAGGYFFIESDDLVNHSDRVLESLSRWMGLNKPLKKSYSEFRFTGKGVYGDFSDNIKAGKIKKTKGYPNIKIPQEILQRAEYSYKKCKASLMRHSIK